MLCVISAFPSRGNRRVGRGLTGAVHGQAVRCCRAAQTPQQSAPGIINNRVSPPPPKDTGKHTQVVVSRTKQKQKKPQKEHLFGQEKRNSFGMSEILHAEIGRSGSGMYRGTSESPAGLLKEKFIRRRGT